MGQYLSSAIAMLAHAFRSAARLSSSLILTRHLSAFSAHEPASGLAEVFVQPTSGGCDRRIQVVQNDLTKESTDAIVNAANSWLKHGGGLAGAILRQGGEVIQEESDEYIEKKGPVATGSTVVTGAGALPCKAVIHAVGPVWNGGSSNEDRDLQSAVMNSLLECDKLQYKSVSIPAISSGIFGFPKERCAKILFSETIEFLRTKENTSLELVRFTNFDKPTVDVFLEHVVALKEGPGLKVELHFKNSKI